MVEGGIGRFIHSPIRVQNGVYPAGTDWRGYSVEHSLSSGKRGTCEGEWLYCRKRCQVAAGTRTRKGRFVRVVVIVPVASKRMSIKLPPQEGARA